MNSWLRVLSVPTVSVLLLAGLAGPAASESSGTVNVEQQSAAAGGGPDPVSAPELVPAEDRVPGFGLKSELGRLRSAMDEPATSSPSAAVGAGPAEQDNLPDPPTLDGFGPMSLSPGCAAWGVLYWHHDDSVPNGGLVHLYDVELYRSSDDVMVYEGVHDFTLSFLPIRSPVTDDCDSALPGDQDVPIVVPGASYYAKVSAWNGVGWSSPAVSESREAVTLPGLDDEATWGDCVCETSTGRLFPLNILRGDPVNAEIR